MRRPPNKLHVFTGIVYYFAGYAKMMRNFPEHRAIETITKLCVDLRRTLRRQGKMHWEHLKKRTFIEGLHRETGRNKRGQKGIGMMRIIHYVTKIMLDKCVQWCFDNQGEMQWEDLAVKLIRVYMPK